MSELKVMAAVGSGALLLSVALDIVLLKLGASGEMLAVGLLLVGALASVVMTIVFRRYDAIERRREREETLLR